jgi:hypothetical protein
MQDCRGGKGADIYKIRVQEKFKKGVGRSREGKVKRESEKG